MAAKKKNARKSTSSKPQVNKYGLSRTIPSPIKRTIRQRCGYGCVCCGLGIYDYEHVDPEFKDAHDHLPSAMCLLCGQCHTKVTRNAMFKETVKRGLKNPYCIKNGYTFEDLDVWNDNGKFTVSIGGAVFEDPKSVLNILGEEILIIESPEEPGAPPIVSGKFYNESGALLFEIEKNRWLGSIKSWDIETKGSSIIVRSASRKILLKLKQQAQDQVAIERLDMFYKGVNVEAGTKGITISDASKKRKITLSGKVTDAEYCVRVRSK